MKPKNAKPQSVVRAAAERRNSAGGSPLNEDFGSWFRSNFDNTTSEGMSPQDNLAELEIEDRYHAQSNPMVELGLVYSSNSSAVEAIQWNTATTNPMKSSAASPTVDRHVIGGLGSSENIREELLRNPLTTEESEFPESSMASTLVEKMLDLEDELGSLRHSSTLIEKKIDMLIHLYMKKDKF